MLTLAPGARVPMGLPVGSGAPGTVQWTAGLMAEQPSHAREARDPSRLLEQGAGSSAHSWQLVRGAVFHRWSLRIGRIRIRTKGGCRQGLMQIRCCPWPPGLRLRGFTKVASPRLVLQLVDPPPAAWIGPEIAQLHTERGTPSILLFSQKAFVYD